MGSLFIHPSTGAAQVERRGERDASLNGVYQAYRYIVTAAKHDLRPAEEIPVRIPVNLMRGTA